MRQRIFDTIGQIVDVVKVDALARQKNSKRHFLRDISKSFQEVTPMGPEPHQFFSFSNISTNMVARGIQSFGRNGPWLAGWLSNGQNFFVNLAQTWDEEMLKISGRYLDSSLSNVQITEKLLSHLPPQWSFLTSQWSKCPLWWQVAQQISSYSVITQTRIKISFWNFQHLFISWVC